MTPALKAMVDAMAAEIVRQTDDQIWRGDDPKFVHIGIYAAQYGNGENNGRIDLEKVARAGLEAIPPEELAAALLAAIGASHQAGAGGYYVFGTTDGVQEGEKEDLTDVGLDGRDDLVALTRSALHTLGNQGVRWEPGHDGVLVAKPPLDAILKDQP